MKSLTWKNPVFILVLLAAFFLVVYRDLIFNRNNRAIPVEQKPIPDVVLSSFDESQLTLFKIFESFASKKFILSLWATWCEPCVKELPLIQANLSRLKKENTEVIMVNYDGGIPAKVVVEVKAWLLSQNVQLNSYFDFKEELLQKLEIQGLPFTIGVGADRKIQWAELGELDWNSDKIRVD